MHSAFTQRRLSQLRRGASQWAAVACGAVLLVRASADDEAITAVTEFEDAPRRLVSLLHEPQSAAVSPNGGLLATGHIDGSIVLWDSETASPVRNLLGHDDVVSSLSFDASGSRIASAGYDQSARVWDVQNGETIYLCEEHTSRLTVAVLSPDGRRLLTGGYDKIARVWELGRPDAEPIAQAECESTIRAAAISPDGQRFAVSNDTGGVLLKEIDSVGNGRRADADSGPIRTLIFSPNGKFLLSGGEDGSVLRWDAKTLAQESVLSEVGSQPLHAASVTGLAFGSGGRLLMTADRQGQIQTWDVTSRTVTSVLEAHDDEVVGLGVSAVGESLLSVSRDRTVRQWRAKLPLTPRLATIDDAGVRLWTMAVSPDGAVLYAAGRDGLLAAWSVETGGRVMTYEGFDGTIDAVSLTSDGMWIACCSWREETISVFDAQSGDETKEIETGAKVRCVRFSPDDRHLVSGSDNGSFTVWNWRTGEEIRTLSNSSLPVYDASFSPDGTQLAVARGEWREPKPGDVTFWNTDGWSEIHKRTEHTRAVRTVTFDRRGTQAASAGEDGTVILWHSETHVPVARLQNSAGVRPVAFSPDGTRLAVGLHDGTINVWDVAETEVIQRFQTEDDVFGVTFSKDGTVLFSVSGEERIEIWPVEGATSTAEQISRWTGNHEQNGDDQHRRSP